MVVILDLKGHTGNIINLHQPRICVIKCGSIEPSGFQRRRLKFHMNAQTFSLCQAQLGKAKQTFDNLLLSKLHS